MAQGMNNNYQDDTLTSASRHRAASRALFQQWKEQQQRKNGVRGGEGGGGRGGREDGAVQQQQRGRMVVEGQRNRNGPNQQKYFQLLHQSMLQGSTTFDHQHQLQSPHGGGGGGAPSAAPSLAVPAHPPIMLHRSPSGAQRKIRQKAQQQQQQQQQFPLASNGFSQSSSSSTSLSCSASSLPPPAPPSSYRALIQENGYKSLLGAGGTRERAATTTGGGGDKGSPSVGQLIDRMNRLDTVITGSGGDSGNNNLGPDSSQPPWAPSGPGGGSIDKMAPSGASLMAASLLGDHPQQQTTPLFAKPTVQVHPLSVPPRHRSMSVLNSSSSLSGAPMKLTPPPLPPKKHSLMVRRAKMEEDERRKKGEEEEKRVREADERKNERQQSAATGGEDNGKSCNNDDAASSMFRWAPSTVLSETEDSSREQIEEKKIAPQGNSTAIPYGGVLPTSPLFCSPPSSLSSSPSLTSLQNSLQFAAENPEKHSREQLQELEERRVQSIESLARKIADREQDRALLDGDIADIGHIRAALLARIGRARPGLAARARLFLAQLEQMAELDTRLHAQMERMMRGGGSGGGGGRRKGEEGERGEDTEWKADMARRLRQQLADLQFVRRACMDRERELDAEMAQELGGGVGADTEALQEWLFCREQAAKLAAERCQLDQRLRDVRSLLQSLQAICLQARKVEEEENGEEEHRREEQEEENANGLEG